MRIEAVIPAVSVKYLNKLLESIKINTCIPDAVHIINNSSEPLKLASSSVLNTIVYGLNDHSLNYAWNTAKRTIFSDADICVFLNDDIELNRYYFENIKERFKHQPKIMALCPVVVPKLKHEKTGKLSVLRKRFGCCFALRKTLLDKLPYIPAELKTFFGDDFWFVQTVRLGHNWYVDESNFITHKVGVAVKKLGVRPDLNKERILYKTIMEG